MASKRDKEKREARYEDAKTRLDGHESGFEPTSFKPPEGVSVFRFRKPGTYTVDIIPYIVKRTKHDVGGNPFVENKGSAYWERTFWDHSGIGIEPKERYCCPRKNWKKACPICEDVTQRYRRPDANNDPVVKALREKERQLFRFIVHEEKEKGIQIFEGSHFRGFGEMLEKKLKAARAKSDTHKFLSFFRLDKGMSLEITVEEEKFKTASGSGAYNAVANIEFISRDEPLDESLLEEGPNLDDILIERSYKELDKILNQTGGEDKDEDDDTDEEDQDTPPKKGDKKKPAEDDEDDDNEQDDEEEETEDDEEEDEKPSKKAVKIKKGDYVTTTDKRCKDDGELLVIHVSDDGTSLKLENDDGDIFKPIEAKKCKLVVKKDDDEDDDADDDEEDEKPLKKKPADKKKPVAKDDDEDEDEDAEDEDEDKDDPDEDKEDEDSEGGDDDDEPLEDDDEEEEKPVKKKPAGKKR